MVPLCYFAAMYTRSPQCHMSGKSLRTPSSIILVGWYRFFQHFVAFCCYLWHPRSPQFASNLLTCCAMWTWSMRIQFDSLWMHIETGLQRASCERPFDCTCWFLFRLSILVWYILGYSLLRMPWHRTYDWQMHVSLDFLKQPSAIHMTTMQRAITITTTVNTVYQLRVCTAPHSRQLAVCMHSTFWI